MQDIVIYLGPLVPFTLANGRDLKFRVDVHHLAEETRLIDCAWGATNSLTPMLECQFYAMERRFISNSMRGESRPYGPR